jgi:hypothetical protein
MHDSQTFDLDLWYRLFTEHRIQLMHEFRFAEHYQFVNVEEWLRVQGQVAHCNARMRELWEGFNVAPDILE